MQIPDGGSLRLDPPRLTADEHLGERLAAAARASVPAPPARRRPRWRLPVAGVVVALATAGAAIAADQARERHDEPPAPVVPAELLEPASVAPASPDTPSSVPTPTAASGHAAPVDDDDIDEDDADEKGRGGRDRPGPNESGSDTQEDRGEHTTEPGEETTGGARGDEGSDEETTVPDVDDSGHDSGHEGGDTAGRDPQETD